MPELIRKKKKMSSFEMIAFGFAGVILLGAIILMLPISSSAGVVTPFDKTLFTATSAVCVTGLVVVDTGSMRMAPISSIRNVPCRINFVSRTIPPTFGAEIASCIVLRCINEIFLPETIEKDATTVITPNPPVWIRSKITAWPNADQ